MSETKVVNRLGKYKASVTGNLKKYKDSGNSGTIGFKTSIPQEIANKWGFIEEVNSIKAESSKNIDLNVFLYAERRDDGNIVLIVSKEPLEEDLFAD